MCRPARSSADVCQRGTVCQCIGGGNTPCGVSPHPRGHSSPWDWYSKAMASTIQWANLCLETAFPFYYHCSRQKLLRASEALTDSSSSTGPLCSPARTIERSQEGTRGGLGRCNLLAPLRNLTVTPFPPRQFQCWFGAEPSFKPVLCLRHPKHQLRTRKSGS